MEIGKVPLTDSVKRLLSWSRFARPFRSTISLTSVGRSASDNSRVCGSNQL